MIPTRQIGWDNQTILYWNISKQLEQLICIACNIPITTATTSSSTTVPTTTSTSSTTSSSTTAIPTTTSTSSSTTSSTTTTTTEAPNYFVSNTGNDANNGLTEATAWQTIAKVISSTFAPGDQILFNRGDEWREQLTVPQSNLAIDAYGTGAKPIINAANIVTGWNAAGSEVVLSDEKVLNGTFNDGTSWTLGTAASISGGVLNVGSTSTFQGSIFASTKKYRYSLDVVHTSGTLLLQYAPSGLYTFKSITESGAISDVVTINGTPASGRIYISGAGSTVDNLSIKEVLSDAIDRPNVWKANCPTIAYLHGIPNNYMCIVDGAMFTQVASLDLVNGAGKYYVDTSPSPDVIYIYSTVDPATLTIEVTARWAGVLIDKMSNINVSNIVCKYAGHSGIYLYGDGAAKTYGNSKIANCETYYNRDDGIMMYYGYCNSTVSYCTSSYNGNNFYSAAAQEEANSGSDNNTFSHCASSHSIPYSAGTGLYTDGHAFGIYDSDNCIVENCISNYDTDAIHIDPAGNARSAIIRYNQIYNAVGGTQGIGFGDLGAGATIEIYYNLIVNGSGAGIMSYSFVGGGLVFIYNNTIYLNNASGTIGSVYLAHGNNLVFKNNIVMRDAGDYKKCFTIESTGMSTNDHNQYFNTRTDLNPSAWHYNGTNYASIAAWRTAVSQDENSQWGDPLFINVASDWTLQAGSPCINAGEVISGIPQFDILGNPIVGNPDIGAYEKQ